MRNNIIVVSVAALVILSSVLFVRSGSIVQAVTVENGSACSLGIFCKFIDMARMVAAVGSTISSETELILRLGQTNRTNTTNTANTTRTTSTAGSSRTSETTVTDIGDAPPAYTATPHAATSGASGVGSYVPVYIQAETRYPFLNAAAKNSGNTTRPVVTCSGPFTDTPGDTRASYTRYNCKTTNYTMKAKDLNQVTRTITSSYSNSDILPLKRNTTQTSTFNYGGWYDGLFQGHKEGLLISTNICHYPVSINNAKIMYNEAKRRGVTDDYLLSEKSWYVDWNQGSGISGVISTWINAKPFVTDGLVDSSPSWGICLDADYVSNYPAYINNWTAFVNKYGAGSYTGKITSAPLTVLKFGETLCTGATRSKTCVVPYDPDPASVLPSNASRGNLYH
ncbi:MAG: hypothetical protein WCP09_03935 [Candidatus Taylorbacteria bacterium]